MSNNNTHVEPHLKTAGKITILTTLLGVVGFLFVFLLNVGQSEFQQAQAQQTATTSVNVLNTPPEFVLVSDRPIEEIESSATNPTNSGDELAIIGTGTDQNNAPYFLLVCRTNAASAQAGDGNGSTAPICTNGDQIAVSTSTVSGQQARAATTTTEAFAESNDWYAFACDDDPVNPECSAGFQGADVATGTSPFIVNHRPSFTAIDNNGPINPGDVLTFTATSSDSDTEGAPDTVQLVVCVANDYNTTTNECGPGGTIATSTLVANTPAAATTTSNPLQDDIYDAFVFVVDNHGHEAAGIQASNEQYTVSNVAPTVDSAQISLNGGDDMALTVAAGETTGFTLSFVVDDQNSCENSSGGDEVTNYIASVYRSGVGSSTCDTTAANYDPNSCYPSAVGAGTWNVSCTATTTGAGQCGGSDDRTELWECTFPLWYVADPTDPAPVTPFYEAEDWRAAVAAVDDNNATSTLFEQADTGVEVQSFLMFTLDTAEIPYGSLAPGGDVAGSSTINTTVRPTGNVGIDTNLSGVHMCPDSFAIGTCPDVASTTATSSIAVYQQEYATTTAGFVYNGSVSTDLTNAPVELELNVLKATSTLTQPTGVTYWGIQIPGSISFAGLYTGRNTIQAVTGESADWY